MARHAATALLASLLILLPASVSRAGEPTGLQRTIDLDAKEEPLASVVDRIRTMTGEMIVIGTDKDGLDLRKNKDLRVTIHLEGAFWETALRLACENAGAKVEVVDGNIWRVYQPPEINLDLDDLDPKALMDAWKRMGVDPERARKWLPPSRYVLTLAEADLSVVAMLLAELGELNVVFDSSLVRGKKVTLRVRDLPWEEALDAVVRAAGLVLVADGEGGRKKVVESGAKGEAARAEPGIPAGNSTLRVSAVLYRPRGGKGLVVVNGETLFEGEEKPVALSATGKTAHVRLEKVEEDGSAVLSVEGERRVVKAGGTTGGGR